MIHSFRRATFIVGVTWFRQNEPIDPAADLPANISIASRAAPLLRQTFRNMQKNDFPNVRLRLPGLRDAAPPPPTENEIKSPLRCLCLLHFPESVG